MKRIGLFSIGGAGDTLYLSAPAKRLKEIFPNCEIHIYANPSYLSILGSNPNITKLNPVRRFNDYPIHEMLLQKEKAFLDLLVVFRYGVKSFWKEKFDLDVPFEEIEKRQKKYELDLWVRDISYWRMKQTQERIQQMYETNELGFIPSWFSLGAYLSGIDFKPEDMWIYTEKYDIGIDNYISVSLRSPFRGLSKLWPVEKWNELFRMFPKENFVLLGNGVNVSGIDTSIGNIIDLRNSTNLYQTAYIIKNSKFLITEEGGLMHVCKAVGNKAIVLFGPTQKFFFGYDDFINLREDTDCYFCHNLWPFWETKCFKNKNLEKPFCKALEKLSVDKVAACVELLLEDAK